MARTNANHVHLFSRPISFALIADVEDVCGRISGTVTDGGRLADEVFSALPYKKRAYTSL